MKRLVLVGCLVVGMLVGCDESVETPVVVGPEGGTPVPTEVTPADQSAISISEDPGPAKPEQDGLARVQEEWMAAKARDRKPVIERYVKDLERLRDSLTKLHRFADAVVVRDEIKRVSAEATLPADTVAGAPVVVELDSVRSRHFDEMAEADAVHDKDYAKALRQLLTRHADAGELEEAMDVEAELKRMVRELEVAGGKSRWAAIEYLSPNKGLAVVDLEQDVERLSGRYRPKFSMVGEIFAGTQFVRVPFESHVRVKVRVLRSGDLLCIGPSKPHFWPGQIEWAKFERTKEAGPLQGAYLGHVSIATVERGDEFSIDGGEVSFIADEIIVKPW